MADTDKTTDKTTTTDTHDHSHEHAHDHESHDHGDSHEQEQEQEEHVHGPGCSHDHDHGQEHEEEEHVHGNHSHDHSHHGHDNTDYGDDDFSSEDDYAGDYDEEPPPKDYVGKEDRIVKDGSVVKIISVPVIDDVPKLPSCLDKVKLSYKVTRTAEKQEEGDEMTTVELEQETEVEFVVDEAKFHIPGVDLAILSMKVGEQATVRCAKGWSYGDQGLQIPEGVDMTGADQGATDDVHLTLLEMEPGFTPPQEITGDDADTKRAEIAKEIRQQGNVQFKTGELDKALRRYYLALDYVEADGDEPAVATQLEHAIPLWGNLAAVFLKLGTGSAPVPPPPNAEPRVSDPNACLGDLEEAARLSRLVLAEEHDPKNIKAMLRLGTCLTVAEEYDEAVTVLKAAVKLDPKNRSVRKAYTKAADKKKAESAAEKRKYKNMFKRGIFSDTRPQEDEEGQHFDAEAGGDGGFTDDPNPNWGAGEEDYQQDKNETENENENATSNAAAPPQAPEAAPEAAPETPLDQFAAECGGAQGHEETKEETKEDADAEEGEAELPELN